MLSRNFGNETQSDAAFCPKGDKSIYCLFIKETKLGS